MNNTPILHTLPEQTDDEKTHVEVHSTKKLLWDGFKKNKIALFSLIFLIVLSFVGTYAPFFASSKPILVLYHGKVFSPLMRYLFYKGFFTKSIDLFFNVLMCLLPLFFLCWLLLKDLLKKPTSLLFPFLIAQLAFTYLFSLGIVKDPELNTAFIAEKERNAKRLPNFEYDLSHFNDYEKINLLTEYKQKKAQKERLTHIASSYKEKTQQILPILYELDLRRDIEEKEKLHTLLLSLEEEYKNVIEKFPSLLKTYLPYSHNLTLTSFAYKEANPEQKPSHFVSYEKALKEEEQARIPIDMAEALIYKYRYAKARLNYLEKKRSWLEEESHNLHILLSPFIRSFHWEEDAGGGQNSNPYLPWWERTRLNRKDLTSALIFGIRVSLIVGFSTILLSLLIGIPLGLTSGYFAGKVDMITLRCIEIWEAMPTFFTLLLISALLQSKSLFLTILILGLFGWTGFARYIRAEVLRERNLPYVMASRSLGFRHPRIMFSHILPNAISPVLALLPFAMMAAITSEAALSFLGLGEEGSTSWGVLMSEARSVFPGESYLLWPPALLLTLLLVAIALVGDGLRDALDPKMR